MANKTFYDGGRADKNMNLVVRIGTGAIMLITFLLMFIIKPKGGSNLWEAVHPYHWFFDSIALIGFIGFCLYISGLAGKVVYAFTGPRTANSSGLIHVIAVVCACAMILFFA